MNKDIAVKWVDALTSGRYKRGTGQLRTHKNEYDVLGVLCDVAKDTFGDRWKQNPRENWSFMGLTFYAPVEVLEWAGFDLEELDDDDRVPLIDDLVSKWDNGSSFDEIADFITKYVDVL